MGEIVQIFVGQAGVQIANACWELYCLENGICSDGTLMDCPYDDTYKNIFYFKAQNKVVPRAILVDSDPMVIDQIQRSAYGCLYNPGCLICGKEDSGCLFPRGCGAIGSELIDVTMEAFRRVVESCCHLRGILIYRSVGGGTGSGLGNLILDRLMEEYNRVSKMEFIIFPSESISPLTVEPYNAMLATHFSMDAVDCSFIMDNEALFDIAATKLNKCAPSYQNLDRIVAQVSTTFTTSQRFGCHSGISFAEYQTNLVPYPRIHFPVVSYAPFIPECEGEYAKVTTEQITVDCFEPCNQLVRCNPKEGNYMSCLLLYRGNVTPGCIDAGICNLKKCEAIRFVDWQPTDFKIGINTRPPFMVPTGGLGSSDKAVLALSSNTVIQRVWCRLVDKFNSIYCIRAYLHHYTAEGMEEDAFNEALEDISALIADYREVEMTLPVSPIPCGQCGIIRDPERQCGCETKCKGVCCATKEIVKAPCQLKEIAKPFCPSANIPKPVCPSTSIAKPVCPSDNIAKPVCPSNNIAKPVCPATNIARPIPEEVCPTSTCSRPSPKPCSCTRPIARGNACYKCGQPVRVQVRSVKNGNVPAQKSDDNQPCAGLCLPGCNRVDYAVRPSPTYAAVRPQCHCQVMGGYTPKAKPRYGTKANNNDGTSDDGLDRSTRLNMSLPLRTSDENTSKKKK